MKGYEILSVARPHIGEKYVYGAAVPYKNPNWRGPWDCAEFATWCVYQTYGFLFGCDLQSGAAGTAYTGAWREDAEARAEIVDIDSATRTPGAFLLRYPNSAAKRIGHIAISCGDGSTVEAADSTRGVIAGEVHGRRWDIGVLLPNVDYSAQRFAETSLPTILRSEQFPIPDDRVKEVQLALRTRGFDPGPIDGLFGETTESAVAAFQASAGVVVDGEVGPKTAELLLGKPPKTPETPVIVRRADAGIVPAQPIQSTKFDDLRDEYLWLFGSLAPSVQKAKAISAAVDRVEAGRARYEQTAKGLGAVPWYVIGVINELESTSRFDTHLHNGDPLTDRTQHVPAGRPPHGNPPFTWEESAIDALQMLSYDKFSDWRLSRVLHRLEAYNGWGTRRRMVFTPYLWSGSQHYVKGKYGEDGKWDPNLVSKQIGCAVILHELETRGIIELERS